jgi:hypothetical protein
LLIVKPEMLLILLWMDISDVEVLSETAIIPFTSHPIQVSSNQSVWDQQITSTYAWLNFIVIDRCLSEACCYDGSKDRLSVWIVKVL